MRLRRHQPGENIFYGIRAFRQPLEFSLGIENRRPLLVQWRRRISAWTFEIYGWRTTQKAMPATRFGMVFHTSLLRQGRSDVHT